MSWKSTVIVVLVFALLILGGAGLGMWMTARQGGTVDVSGLQALIKPVTGFLVYIFWVAVILGVLRPRLAQWWSQRFRITVEESADVSGIAGSGGWTLTSNWPIWQRLVFHVSEVLIFVVLSIGPLATGILLY